ncbi:TPA: CS1-pili formation C-terminal domain-containing protein [Photobacterium damselae]
MNKKICILSLLVSSALAPNGASAKFIPDGFEHFYDFKKNDVTVYLPNNKRKTINVTSNIEKIKKINTIEVFTNDLLLSGVKKERIPDVISAIISTKKTKIKVDYSYDKKTIKLEIPSEYMDDKSQISAFTDAEPDGSALITRNRFYGSAYDGRFDASLNNYSTFGFNKSHINLDTTLRTNGDETFSVESASFVQDLKGYSISLGYSDYGSNIVNSTSVFDYANTDDEFSLSVFSNDNLLINDGANIGKLYFDMKGTGSYQVKRNGKVIYNGTAQKGQNFVSYKKLPVGIYQIELELRPDGMRSESVIRQVVNVSSITSRRGFDYSFSYRSAESEFDNKKYSSDYINIAGTYSLFDEQLLVGGNLAADNDDTHIGIGARALINDLNLNSYVSELSGNGIVFAFNTSFKGFNLDYRNVKLDDFDELSALTLVRYGDHSYKQTSFSYTFPFYGSNLNIMASKYEQEYTNDKENESSNLSFNYQKYIFKNIQLGLNYVIESNNEFDENIIGVSLNIPLNDVYQYDSSYEYSTVSGSRFRNTINYDDDVEFTNLDMSNYVNLSENIERNNSNIMLGAGSNISNDYFMGNAFLSMSNNGYSNLTLSANTTSILTEDGAFFTKDSADSFILLVNNSDSKDDLGLIDLHKNNNSRQRKAIKSGYTVVPIDNYSDYQVSIDNEVSGYKSVDNTTSAEIFSYPGTAKKIDNQVREVVNFLTYFEDFDERPLNDIECKGQGCVSVDKVGNGVYNISVIKDNDFKLTSNNQICLVDNDVINHNNDASKCFPSISEQENGLQLVTRGFNKNEDEVVYYIGVKEDAIPAELSARIESMNMSVVEYEFNSKTHLFVKVNKGKNTNTFASTFDLINQVQKYASIEKNVGNYTRIN